MVQGHEGEHLRADPGPPLTPHSVLQPDSLCHLNAHAQKHRQADTHAESQIWTHLPQRIHIY